MIFIYFNEYEDQMKLIRDIMLKGYSNEGKHLY